MMQCARNVSGSFMNVDGHPRFSRGYYDSVAWFEHTKLFVGEMTFSFQKLHSLVSPSDVRVILDCGCGLGGAKPFIDRVFSTTYIGIDVTSYVCVSAKHNITSGEIITADAGTLPVKERSIDLCVVSHVLGHLPQPVSFFHELARVLRPQGLLLLITPNKGYVNYVSRPIGRLVQRAGTDRTIIKRYSMNELHQLCHQFQFEILFARYFGFGLYTFTINWDTACPVGRDIILIAKKKPQ
jgi:ubiquinone/menaquinone biosynthesis C-methylase UbiE